MWFSRFFAANRSKFAGRRRSSRESLSAPRVMRLERLEERRVLSATAFGDFNGDGYQDMALGLPAHNVGDVKGAGAVHVVYGTAQGLDEGHQEFWYQGAYDPKSNASITGSPRELGHFGKSVAAGDFNGDGYGDLAVAADGSGPSYASRAHVIYGSSEGLKAKIYSNAGTSGLGFYGLMISVSNHELYGMGDYPDLLGFGRTMVTGDFNGDGSDDLAVGVADCFTSSVHVFYGGYRGLRLDNGPGAIALSPWNTGGKDDEEQGLVWGNYGWSLATGDFNGDGADDLAIGTPGTYKPNGDGVYVGAKGYVVVVYGQQGAGFKLKNSTEEWRPQIFDKIWPENGIVYSGQYGHSLAAGDFNGDGNDDLAIGHLGLRKFHVYYGGAARLNDTNGPGYQLFGPAPMWPNNPELEPGHAGFGTTLAAADFDGNGADDLAISEPNYFSGAGRVQVIYGTAIASLGLSKSPSLFGYSIGPVQQVWSKGDAGIIGDPYGFEETHFSSSLAVGDVDGNGRADLAVHSPGVDFLQVEYVGYPRPDTINVIYAGSSGLAAFPVGAPGNELWSEGGSLEGLPSQQEFDKLVKTTFALYNTFAVQVIGVPALPMQKYSSKTAKTAVDTKQVNASSHAPQPLLSKTSSSSLSTSAVDLLMADLGVQPQILGTLNTAPLNGLVTPLAKTIQPSVVRGSSGAARR